MDLPTRWKKHCGMREWREEGKVMRREEERAEKGERKKEWKEEREGRRQGESKQNMKVGSNEIFPYIYLLHEPFSINAPSPLSHFITSEPIT